MKGYKFIGLKKEDKEKSKSQLEETIAKRVKLRKQKADDKNLTHTSFLEVDDDSDEFIDISDMPPLEGNKK